VGVTSGRWRVGAEARPYKDSAHTPITGSVWEPTPCKNQERWW
jgi:hypothetical protein